MADAAALLQDVSVSATASALSARSPPRTPLSAGSSARTRSQGRNSHLHWGRDFAAVELVAEVFPVVG